MLQKRDEAEAILSPRERWWRAFVQSDPRRHLAEYFKEGDERGPYGFLRSKGLRPMVTSEASEFFTVWRPTTIDAMRMLFEGTAVGKALNIKGKSALRGPLKGFVPFLQISEEAHKRAVRISPAEARARVFFQSFALREEASEHLHSVLADMQAELATIGEKRETQKSAMTDDLLSALGGGGGMEEDSNWGGLIGKSLVHEQAGRDLTLRSMQCTCADPTITDIDEFAQDGIYGLDVPERLLWEAYVVRQDITLPAGCETGRASEPAFMDLNLHATRDRTHRPAVSIWQHDAHAPMNPLTLLMAHEERHVRPVASDMDPFLMGSRGMQLQRPLPREQVELMRWTVEHIEAILGEPKAQGWNKRWLEVLRHGNMHSVAVPEYGFGDPQSYEILAKVIEKVESSGAVRHGAEAFNYLFPQALDTEFLVVWSGFSLFDPFTGRRGAPWRYLSEPELRSFLIHRAAHGFAFPLNPKWILCDAGWAEVYAAMRSSKFPEVQAAMNVWMPAKGGLREAIDAISQRHPEGFCVQGADAHTGEGVQDEDVDFDLAEWELRRLEVLKRARVKVKALVRLIMLSKRMALPPSPPAP